MRRALPLAAVVVLALAGCASEPEVVEVTQTSWVAPTEGSATATTESATGSFAESAPGASTSNGSTSAPAAPPDCSDAALQRSPGYEDFEMRGECEGGFARPGVPNSDVIKLVQWDGSIWHRVPADGEWDGLGMSAPCYNPGHLEELGVPERFANKEKQCGVYGPGETPPNKVSAAPAGAGYIPYVGLGESTPKYASQPACDGRGILIVDSIVDYGDRDDTQRRIAFEALTADPSGKTREYTFPGQCPSLRKQLDGHDIYPVYLDYGSDTDALCRAKANYGGNARVLSNREEYVDPC